MDAGDDDTNNNNNNNNRTSTPKRSKPSAPLANQSTHVGRRELSASDNRKIANITEMVKVYLFTEVDRARIEAIVVEAFENNDKNFSIREAVE